LVGVVVDAAVAVSAEVIIVEPVIVDVDIDK
jgi:hypothetical protein